MARDYDGAGDYISYGDLAIDGISNMSVMVWGIVDTATALDCLVGKSQDNNNRWSISVGFASGGGTDDYTMLFGQGSNTWIYTTGNILVVGINNHLGIAFDGSQSTNATKYKFYFNGTSQSLTYTAGTVGTTTPNAGTAAVYSGQERMNVADI